MNTFNRLTIINAASDRSLAVAGGSQVAGAFLTTTADSGADAQRWHAIPMNSNQYVIENMNSHQVMGISGASTADGEKALQWADNGTNDHNWSFYKLANGNYLIKNLNSNLYLSADSGGVVTQTARAAGSAEQEWKVETGSDAVYPAPITLGGTGLDVHDPDMIQDAAGNFWLYGTHNTLASSIDFTNFATVGNGIINPDFDWWASKNTVAAGGRTDIWAPSIKYANGLYYLYYSIPIYGTPSQVGTNMGPEAVIALATSPNPDGPWTDRGEIISSCGTRPGCTTTFNAIDPAPFTDEDGNWWLTFGSWNDGIHVLQMDPTTGLRLASNQTIYDIARRGAGEEGAFIFPYVVNGTRYYFYFASINICCSGTNSLYRIITGRSTSPTGPFLDRGGLDLMDGGGTILLSTHGTIYGPGGQSVMDTDDGPMLVYHYYDGTLNGAPRLGLNRLTFDNDGWPRVE